jgi:hypothetical protein
MRALVVAAEHVQPAGARLPHLPKGDRLLESHARNSAKSHSQSEYGMRHRLTEWHGPAGLIRKVARAAYQRVKQQPRSFPTARRLPPASAEVAAAFTFNAWIILPDVNMSMTGKISNPSRGPLGLRGRIHRLRARSRSVNFCTLPVAVVGSGPNTTDFGALKCASRSRQKAMISSAVA